MKNQVRVYTFLLIILVTLLPILGMAGGSQGGGGGGKICKITANDSVVDMMGDRQIKTYLLEFWEAEKGLAPFKEKIQIPESDDPVEKQVLRAINKVKKVNMKLGVEILRAYRHVSSPKVKYTRPDMKVRPPRDTIQPFEGNNCVDIGIGEFFDGRSNSFYSHDPIERLNYDEKALNQMSKTHQAGFWFHEAAYYVFRNFSANQNSVVARILNVFAFSKQEIPNIAAKPKGASVSYWCKTDDNHEYSDRRIDSEFYLHKLRQNILVVPVTFAGRNKHNFLASNAPDGALYMFERVPSVYNPPIDTQLPMDNPDFSRRFELGAQTDYNNLSLFFNFGNLENMMQPEFKIEEWSSVLYVRGWEAVVTANVSKNLDRVPITCKVY